MVIKDSSTSSNNCKYCNKYFTTAKSVKLHEDIFCPSKNNSDPLALDNEDPLAIDNTPPKAKALISQKIFEKNLRSLKRGLEMVSSVNKTDNNNHKKQKLPQGSVKPRDKFLTGYQGITVSKARNTFPVSVRPLKTTIYSKSKENNNKKDETKVVNNDPVEISSDEEEEEWFDEKFEKNNKRDTTFCCGSFFKALELEKHKKEVHNKSASINRIPSQVSVKTVNKTSNAVSVNRISKEISVSKSSNQTSINKIPKEISVTQRNVQTSKNPIDRLSKQLMVNKVSINKMATTNDAIKKLPKSVLIDKVRNSNIKQKEDEDDDDDLILTKMEICTVDPLTKKQIVNPLKNRICSHIYEKSTIYPSIDQATRKRKNMRCPYMGCTNKMVRKSDLVYDPEVSAQIKKNQDDSNEKDLNVKRSTTVDKNIRKTYDQNNMKSDKTFKFNSAISFVKTKSNEQHKKLEVKSNNVTKKIIVTSSEPSKQIKPNSLPKLNNKSESSNSEKSNKSDEDSKNDDKLEFKCNLCNTEYEKATLLMMHKKWMHDVHFQNVPASTKTFNESSLPNVSISRTSRRI